MANNTITVTYDLIYRVRIAHHYQVTKCGKMFNTMTGRQIKRTMCGRSLGYWIRSENKRVFITLNKGKILERIPKKICPF